MLATVVRMAQEFLDYDYRSRRIDMDDAKLDWLCSDARKKNRDIQVVKVDLKSGKIKLEDYKAEERRKYLYALTSGRCGIGPSWPLDLTEKEKNRKKDPPKIVEKGLKKIRDGLEKLLDKAPDKESKDWIQRCLEGLQGRESERIARESERIAEEIKKCGLSDMVLLVVAYGKEGFEVEGVRTAFIENKLMGGQRAKFAGQGVCLVCGKKGEVRASIPFDYYRFFAIVDKPCFSQMGIPERGWRNVPICRDCTLWLAIGENFLRDRLDDKIAGKRALILPDLEPGASTLPGSFVHWLWTFKEKMDKYVPKKVSTEESSPEEREERSLVEGLMDEPYRSGYRYISLVFYEMEGGQKLKFIYTSSDILPRNLEKARELLGKVKVRIRKEMGNLGEGLASSLRENFEFVDKGWKPQEGLRLTPMHLIESILIQVPPELSSFWQDADRILRSTYLDALRGRISLGVRYAISKKVTFLMALWYLFYGEKTLLSSDGRMRESVATEEKDGKKTLLSSDLDSWADFFEERSFLETPLMKGIFLIGVLLGEVEYRQRKMRGGGGEMPVIGLLRGLSLNVEEIKGLLPNLMLKLRELSAHSLAVDKVEEAAGHYLSQGGTIDNERARYTLCLGWALSRLALDYVRNKKG